MKLSYQVKIIWKIERKIKKKSKHKLKEKERITSEVNLNAKNNTITKKIFKISQNNIKAYFIN